MSKAPAGRYQANRRRKTQDRAVHLPGERAKVDDLAEAAECWFGRLYGLQCNRSLRHKDAGYDYVRIFERQGRPDVTSTIDVKWSPHPGAGLLHRLDNPRWATAYVLVTGATPADFSVAGWAYGFELRRETKDLGHGAGYYLPPERLRTNVDMLMATLFRCVRLGDPGQQEVPDVRQTQAPSGR